VHPVHGQGAILVTRGLTHDLMEGGGVFLNLVENEAVYRELEGIEETLEEIK
jgi:hypothetical protein